MDPHTAFELIKTLGILSSMISTYLNFREKIKRGHDEESVKNEVLSAHPSRELLVDKSEVKFIQALPRDLGDAANERIRRALDRYKKAFLSPMNVFELDKESELASWEICNVLHLIMKHNGGQLPTKKLRDLWKSFNCDQAIH